MHTRGSHVKIDLVSAIGDDRLDTLLQKMECLPIPLLLLRNSDRCSALEPEWSYAVASVQQLIGEFGWHAVSAGSGRWAESVVAMSEDEEVRGKAELTVIALLEEAARQPERLCWSPGSSTPAWAGQCPKLASAVDEEGLVSVSGEIGVDRFGFTEGGWRVPFHRCLGNPQFDFICAFMEVARQSDKCVCRIAPDYRKAVRESDSVPVGVKDHWRGRPFKRADLDDARAIGTTVYCAPPVAGNNDVSVQCAFAGVQRLEVAWSYKDGLKTMQMEEVLSREERFPRFAHAIRDVTACRFKHFDGAVMIYSAPDVVVRREVSTTLPKTPKAAHKPKLFRIDGPLSADTVTGLMSLFFRANPLVGEYFEGKVGSKA